MTGKKGLFSPQNNHFVVLLSSKNYLLFVLDFKPTTFRI